MEFRFLDQLELTELHPVFLSAFSDYLVPMNLSREQFAELLRRRGAQKELSVAAFEDDLPIGFTINAFDLYQGIPTVYDVITGIVPVARRKGVAQGMFEFSLPKLKEIGAARYVLEVLAKNSAAFALYKRIGFSVDRELEVFSATKAPFPHHSTSFAVQPIEPMWDHFERFWDWQPSWQNSIASMQRSKAQKVVLGVFNGSQLIAYGIVFPETGDVPQFAVRPDHRKQGAGTMLFMALQGKVQPGRHTRIVNVDRSAAGTLSFLQRIGFESFATQFEMLMQL